MSIVLRPLKLLLSSSTSWPGADADDSNSSSGSSNNSATVVVTRAKIRRRHALGCQEDFLLWAPIRHSYDL